MDIRTQLCFALSRRLMRPPDEHTLDYSRYREWRQVKLTQQWAQFSDEHIAGKDVLDFGCGAGQLSLYLAREKRPRRIVGVDLNHTAIARAKESAAQTHLGAGVSVEFLLGSTDALPVPDQSFDTLIAFACLEHVMSPGQIVGDWFRVLRPGGRCLINWAPYAGPWEHHMKALIPIPWAHVVFGERAMFRAAERIYDLPNYAPRHWDLDEHGNKKPNPWRQWSSFDEQGFLNKLDIQTFQRLARGAGFGIARRERHSFSGARIRRMLGRILMGTPLIGKHFVSHVAIELLRPADSKV